MRASSNLVPGITHKIIDHLVRLPYNMDMVRQGKYTKEFLEPIVKEASSISSLLRSLGLKPGGGNYRHIQQRIKAYNIDTSHFLGQGWAKGQTKETNDSVKKSAAKNSYSNEEIFRKDSTFRPSGLSRRLISLGWEYRCSQCNLETWLGKPITLHVDHINGNASDHRLKNLRFLCPNCHQQTDTWGSRPHRRTGISKRLRPSGPSGCPCSNQGGVNQCIDCNKKISLTATRCKSCAARARNNNKINWPSTNELISRLGRSNYSQLAQELGVSDNAVRKRIREHSLD